MFFPLWLASKPSAHQLSVPCSLAGGGRKFLSEKRVLLQRATTEHSWGGNFLSFFSPERKPKQSRSHISADWPMLCVTVCPVTVLFLRTTCSCSWQGGVLGNGLTLQLVSYLSLAHLPWHGGPGLELWAWSSHHTPPLLPTLPVPAVPPGPPH